MTSLSTAPTVNVTLSEMEWETALLHRKTLRGTAFLPFGAFLAPSIWLGWLAETVLGWAIQG